MDIPRLLNEFKKSTNLMNAQLLKFFFFLRINRVDLIDEHTTIVAREEVVRDPIQTPPARDISWCFKVFCTCQLTQL